MSLIQRALDPMRPNYRPSRNSKKTHNNANNWLRENCLLAEQVEVHLQEAFDNLSKIKIRETVMQWLSRSRLDRNDLASQNTMIEAFSLATQLLLFMPSMTGRRPIDRFIRDRRTKCSPQVQAALYALEQSRFYLLRLKSRTGPLTVSVEDLATTSEITLLDEEIPDHAMGVVVGVYLTPLSNSHFITIGTISPLNAPALAEGLSFIREGKGLSNPQRCAAAIYSHIIRYGAMWLEGINFFPEVSYSNPVIDNTISFDELDRLALYIKNSFEKNEEPISTHIFETRQLTSYEALKDCLARSLLSRHAGRKGLSEAYAHLAFIMMETYERRATAGTSSIENPLNKFREIISQDLIEFVAAAEVNELFDKLRLKITISKNKKTDNKDQETELTRVLLRIQALRNKTIEQGCTEQEAFASATKVAELLDRYGLSLGEVEIREQACEGIGIETGRRRQTPIDDCVPTLGDFCDCKVWREKDASGAIRYVFFGLPADVKAAHYLYEVMMRTFETESLRFRMDNVKFIGASQRSAINSFQIGLAHGICKKLATMKKERDDFNRRSSGRDLVPLKSSIVEEELEKLGMKFRFKSVHRKKLIEHEAFEAGHIAGQKFMPHHGVEDIE